MTIKTVGLAPDSEIPHGAQARIDDQRRRVALFEPGSEFHRMATKTLLLLQDSAHVMAEAEDMIRAAKADADRRAANEP